jgi:hypothetical protein
MRKPTGNGHFHGSFFLGRSPGVLLFQGTFPLNRLFQTFTLAHLAPCPLNRLSQTEWTHYKDGNDAGQGVFELKPKK